MEPPLTQRFYHRRMHLQNQRVQGRLNRRRSGIVQLLLPNLSCEVSSNSNAPHVWVQGSTLRRFFSCTDAMDDLLSSGDKPILRHRQLLCQHGKGLHPRVARKGKMLSSTQYQIYSDLLQMEREEALHGQGGDAPSAAVCDLVIDRETCLRCDECVLEYQNELKKKVETFSVLALLYESLDPSMDNVFPTSENEQVCALSTSFATNFRKFAVKKLKLAAGTKSCLTSVSHNAPVDGIDHFDVSDMSPLASSSEVEVVTKSSDKDEIDPWVNTKIACKLTILNLCTFFRSIVKSKSDRSLSPQVNMEVVINSATNNPSGLCRNPRGRIYVTCSRTLFPSRLIVSTASLKTVSPAKKKTE